MSLVVGRVLVFVSSAAVLVLEILAGRLMAPYVGVSLETFTGIIGTVLAAIALGSWAGGRLADRSDPSPLLGRAFVIGGILALLAPTLTAALGSGLRGGGAVVVVLLTTVAFFAPAAVLSAVTPFVVKLRLASLEETGEVVGSFSAVGTAGALFGTFVTGFVLLATLPTRPIVLSVGILLVGMGLWLMVRYRSQPAEGGDTADDAADGADGAAGGEELGRHFALAVVAGVLLLLVPSPCTWETTYSCANVVVDPDNPEGRTLQLDLLSHSYVDLGDPTNLRFRYIKDFSAVIDATAPEGPLNTLGIGGGGFTMPRWFAAERPGSTNTVYEIDDALVDIAVTELGLDPAAVDLTIETVDARLALARRDQDSLDGSAAEPFDVVVGDAFAGLSVPWHLTTVEFLTMLKASMAPDGVYVMNIIDSPDYDFLRAEIATLDQVFDNLAIVTLDSYIDPEPGDGSVGGNVVVVATDASIDAAAIEANLELRESASTVFTGTELDAFIGDATVLTDDFAPVDQMIDVPFG